jgi:hypothetical protein
MKNEKIYKKRQEICIGCGHAKGFHEKEEGKCNQPTCSCNCFFSSNVYCNMNLFDAYFNGKQDIIKELKDIIEKIAIKPDPRSVTQFSPYVSYEVLIEEINKILGETK